MIPGLWPLFLFFFRFKEQWARLGYDVIMGVPWSFVCKNAQNDFQKEKAKMYSQGRLQPGLDAGKVIQSDLIDWGEQQIGKGERLYEKLEADSQTERK